MRLIDADALDVIGYKGTAGRPDTFDAGVIWALEKTDSMPTIDAVPVVRCRECENWENDWEPSGFKPDKPRYYCAENDLFTKGDWFCADGQRREDGDN